MRFSIGIALVLASCAGDFGSAPPLAPESPPALASVGPGVDAALDSEEPLFYVDGNYYLYRDGVWLESRSYRTGFHSIEHLPGALLRIDRPKRYAHLTARSPLALGGARSGVHPRATVSQHRRSERPMQ
ncbi:MAG: hypothetical protein ACM31C_09010 [Acidobacteriota bacterium]